MPGMAPLKLTLYDPETSEELKTYTRSFIPWKLLKTAVRLSKSLGNIEQENLDEDDIDSIACLVVDAFGGQFTLDALNDGADLGEMISVMQAIVSRAAGVLPNPPKPGKA